MSSNYERNLYKRKSPNKKPVQKAKPAVRISQQHRLDRNSNEPKQSGVIQIGELPTDLPACICDRNLQYVCCLNLSCDWSTVAGRESRSCPIHTNTAYLYDLNYCPNCFSKVKEYPDKLPSDEDDADDL